MKALAIGFICLLFSCAPRYVTNESLIMIMNTYQGATSMRLEALNQKIDRIDANTQIVEKKMRPKQKAGNMTAK